MKWFCQIANLDTRFVDGLPTALIKPLSGSGARGMMVDTMNVFGVDSFLRDFLGFYKAVQILLLCDCSVFWSGRN